MASSDFLPVAASPSANVDPQTNFAGSAYQQNGFVTGTAKSSQANKVWRQASMIGAAWTSLVVSVLGQSVVDDGNVASLSTQFQSLMQQIALNALNGSGLLARMTAAEGNITTLQGQYNSLSSTVNGMQGQISNLLARMAAAEGNINNLQGQMSTANSNISGLQSAMNTVNGQIGDLYNKYNSLAGRVTNLENSFNTMSGQIADLYNRTGTNANNIAANTNSINTLNSEMSTVNSHLATHDQQIAQLMPSSGNGWCMLPNGTMMQWARGYQDTSAGTVYQTVAFPRAFPNNVFTVQVTTQWGSGTDQDLMSYQVSSWNNSSVYLRRGRRGDDNTMTTWPLVFAVGN